MKEAARPAPVGLRRVLSVAATAAGAAVLAGSAFAAWLEVAGSRLSGFRLAETIGGYGDHVTGLPPAWVGAVWYLFPVSAGVCWILLFRRSPPAASGAHAVIGASVAIAAAAYLVAVDSRAGPLTALAGGLLILLGALAGRRIQSLRRGRP